METPQRECSLIEQQLKRKARSPDHPVAELLRTTATLETHLSPDHRKWQKREATPRSLTENNIPVGSIEH